MSCPEPLESLLRRETGLSPGVHRIRLVIGCSKNWQQLPFDLNGKNPPTAT
jgi:hypothetical protein